MRPGWFLRCPQGCTYFLPDEAMTKIKEIVGDAPLVCQYDRQAIPYIVKRELPEKKDAGR